MSVVVHGFVPSSYNVNFVGKEDLNVFERRTLYELFQRYGEIKKLYVCPDGSFGCVSFSSLGAAREAVKKAQNIPPFFLKLSLAERNNEGYKRKSNSVNGSSSVSSDMDDVIEADRTVMYDVYGNPVEVFVDDVGDQYVPYHQMSKAGYKLYTKKEIEKQLKNNDRLLNEFHIYMLTKARKFMRENDLILKEKTIDETISRCRQKIFKDESKKIPTTPTASSTNYKFTIKQNVPHNRDRDNNHNTSETMQQQGRKLRHPNQLNVSGGFEGEAKRLQTIALTLNCYQRVLITHVLEEGDGGGCYVTPYENIESRNELMKEVLNCVKSGKKGDLYKNLIYACQYKQEWHRVKILRKDTETEALLIDQGKKIVVDSGTTLPKNLIDIPAQAVFIKIKDQSVVKLEKGNTIEIKPIQKLDDGYLVEIKPPQPTTPVAENPPLKKPLLPTPNTPPLSIPYKHPQSTPKRTSEITQESSVNQKLETPTKAKITNNDNNSKKLEEETVSRKCLIDNLSSTGTFCCSEIVDAETFVAYLLNEECCEDLAFLDQLSSNCKADADYRPKLGTVVAVEKKDEENVWVRGLISDIKNNEYTCALIDYGVTQTSREIRKLPEQYIRIPDMSCLCKTDAESLKKIEAGGENVVYTVKEKGTLELKLDDESFIVKASLWNPVVRKQQKIYKPVPASTLNDGEILKVKSVVEDTSTLLCETKQCHDRLKEINAHIRTMNEAAERLTAPPVIGQLVLAPCEGEEGLYRGVVKSLKDAKAEIDFLDYGNCEFVAIDRLRNVDEKLGGLEAALVESPKFWYLVGRKLSSRSYDYLEQNVAKRYKAVNCKTKFDLKTSDETLLSTILERLDNDDANRIKHEDDENDKKSLSSTSLSSNFSSFKNEVSQKNSSTSVSLNNVEKPEENKTKQNKIPYSALRHTTLPPGEYSCLCTVADELASGIVTFMLADDKSTNDMLELQSKIEEFVESEKSPFNDAEEGDLCLAIYEDCWNRGVVIERRNNGCLVFFVDFGNTAFVDVKDMRGFIKDLTKIPALAVVCQLDGIGDITATILKDLKTYIKAEEAYEVVVVKNKEEDMRHLIRIPAVYEKIPDLQKS